MIGNLSLQMSEQHQTNKSVMSTAGGDMGTLVMASTGRVSAAHR